MNQQGLFSPEPRAVARNSDPWTSHQAATSVIGIRRSQQAVLNLLKQTGPMTDVEIRLRYRGPPMQSESGLRTRRKELVDLHLVRDSDVTRTLPSGRAAIVWEAV